MSRAPAWNIKGERESGGGSSFASESEPGRWFGAAVSIQSSGRSSFAPTPLSFNLISMSSLSLSLSLSLLFGYTKWEFIVCALCTAHNIGAHISWLYNKISICPTNDVVDTRFPHEKKKRRRSGTKQSHSLPHATCPPSQGVRKYFVYSPRRLWQKCVYKNIPSCVLFTLIAMPKLENFWKGPVLINFIFHGTRLFTVSEKVFDVLRPLTYSYIVSISTWVSGQSINISKLQVCWSNTFLNFCFVILLDPLHLCC